MQRENREEKKYKKGNKTGRPQNNTMKSACNNHPDYNLLLQLATNRN